MPSIILNNLFQINELIKLKNSEIQPKYGNHKYLNKNLLFERKIIQIKCKYQIVNLLAKENYFLTLNEGYGWDIYWTDNHYLSLKQIKSMMPYQKINYIPGICILTNKQFLAQRLNIYRKLFPNEFNFYPKTWIINRQSQSGTIISEQNDEVLNVDISERDSKGNNNDKGHEINFRQDMKACLIKNNEFSEHQNYEVQLKNNDKGSNENDIYKSIEKKTKFEKDNKETSGTQNDMCIPKDQEMQMKKFYDENFTDKMIDDKIGFTESNDELSKNNSNPNDISQVTLKETSDVIEYNMIHSNHGNNTYNGISNVILEDKITQYDENIIKISALFKENKAMESIKNDFDVTVHNITYNQNENDPYEITKNDKDRHKNYDDLKNKTLELERNQIETGLEVDNNENYKRKNTKNEEEMHGKDIDLRNERNHIKVETGNITNNLTDENIDSCESNDETSQLNTNILIIDDANGNEFHENMNSETQQNSSKTMKQDYDGFEKNKNNICDMEKIKELSDTNVDQTRDSYYEQEEDKITQQYGVLMQQSEDGEEVANRSIYILKPCDSCQGKGITLTMNINKSVENLQSETMICQEYIQHPLLWNEYKFDIRFYILITSVKHLRIYIYKEGIVRFATEKYNQPKQVNLNNMFMHLTNYSINKESENFDENCNKKCLKDLNEYLKDKNVNLKILYDRIHDIIVKTVLTGYKTILNEYVNQFKKFIYREACFQLLGFDIILDEHFHPYLLEINKNSSLKRPTQIDKIVKNQLVADMFTILNLNEDRLRGDILRDNLNYNTIRKQIEYELKNRGNFEMIYPSVEHENDYEKFIID